MKLFFSSQLLFSSIFIFSIVTFLAHTAFTKTATFADGRFYYATTRSIAKDHDIKFANDYQMLGIEPSYTTNNYSWNKYPPGVSFFWVFPFLLADGFASLLSFLNLQIDTTGVGIVHQVFVACGSIFLGLIGLILVRKLLLDYFPKQVSLNTTTALFTTTNLLFYIAVEPINSHAASFFVSALFVYYLLRHQDYRYYHLVLGLIGGTAALVRTQDAAIMILALIQTFKVRKRLKSLVTNYLLLAAGALAAFFPQILFWKKIFGTYLYSPYIDEGFNFLKPQIFYVLFNTQNGLLTITPAILIAFIGLFLLNRSLSSPKVYSLVYFFIQLFLVSSWSSFYQGGSYSIRMMITTYPLLSFGLAAVLDKLERRLGVIKSAVVVFLFAALNVTLITRYLLIY